MLVTKQAEENVLYHVLCIGDRSSSHRDETYQFIAMLCIIV